jgi:NhaP-type Na+/H+ and K+/H+ antiporter
MSGNIKTNKYAVAAAIAGMLSIVFYALVLILGTVYPPPQGHHSPLMGAAGPSILILGLSSILVMAPLGVILGLIGLRSIRKSDKPQKGLKLAWTGIAAGGGFILVELLIYFR